ncbi:MAG: aspartate--ammonia ligase [Oscillospiraceae bacterium]|nr:aspartate--ammonia ligase [Oscillospiraceae bacterium]
MSLILPKGYRTVLSVYDTQRAIVLIKDRFQHHLGRALSLKRVSAPLFVRADSGLNDNLSGKERPVGFDVPAAGGICCEVVQSLAKWKRLALKQYDFYVGNGLYTDMNAIRRDETELDNIHSVYVDQWDWEKVITAEQRTMEYLQATVRAIVGAIADTGDDVAAEFPQLHPNICREVAFATSQELEDRWPHLQPRERERAFVKENRTAFIAQIGKRLRSGTVHDGRAPDYDDWELNGDIFFWDDVLERELELSSMGIRVDSESLAKQLREAGCEERAALPFHKMLLADELPLTMGGGIGQSRLCMLLMGSAHIGEVHAGVWDDEVRRICSENGIFLL